MNRTAFLARLEVIKEAVIALDGKTFCWEIGEPAPVETVRRIEEMYSVKLPADFVEMVTQVAGCVKIRWGIRHMEEKFPQFRDIFSGELNWDINSYLEQETYQFYLDCQSGDDWPELRGKLQLCWVPNGDIHLFDLTSGSIFYLDHEGEYFYPVQLAKSFGDYVESLLQIGLVGSEIWQLKKFIQPEPVEESEEPFPLGVIDPACPYALAWREALGL